MKDCRNIDDNCGKKVFARCTSYETELPEFSKLSCPSIEDTTTEQYELIGEIKEILDLESLEGGCVTLNINRKVLNVFQSILDKICAMQDENIDTANTIATMQQQIEELQTNNCT